MPVGVEKCVTTAQELQVNAECSVDLYLKSAIEGVVIKWVTQINGEYNYTQFLQNKESNKPLNFTRRLHGNISKRIQQWSKSNAYIW